MTVGVGCALPCLSRQKRQDSKQALKMNQSGNEHDALNYELKEHLRLTSGCEALLVCMVIGILHCDGDDGKHYRKQARLAKDTFANEYRRVDGEAMCFALLTSWEAHSPMELRRREDLSLDHEERVWDPRDETEE